MVKHSVFFLLPKLIIIEVLYSKYMSRLEVGLYLTRHKKWEKVITRMGEGAEATAETSRLVTAAAAEATTSSSSSEATERSPRASSRSSESNEKAVSASRWCAVHVGALCLQRRQ